MSQFFTITTQLGEKLMANATALGTPIKLTQMSVGDGNGKLPTPDPLQTQLINEKHRQAINTLTIDPKNPTQVIAELVIPEHIGGFWLREVGLFDDKDNLVAVGNLPETYKPQLAEGSGKTQVVRMMMKLSHTESVQLNIDPSVVLATRDYVSQQIKEHEGSTRHPDATLTQKGFTQLDSSVTSANETKAATPKAVKLVNDNANSKVPLTRTINEKPLSSDIILNAKDVGAIGLGDFGLGIPAGGNAKFITDFENPPPSGLYRAHGDGAGDAAKNGPVGTGNTLLSVLVTNHRSDTASFFVQRHSHSSAHARAWSGHIHLGKVYWTEITPLSQINGNNTGWMKFPSGIIMQWGSFQYTTIGKVVNFPIAFPNRCMSVTPGTVQENKNDYYFPQIVARNNANFTIAVYGNAVNAPPIVRAEPMVVDFFAIGY